MEFYMKHIVGKLQTREKSLMSLLPWGRCPTASDVAAVSLGMLEIHLSKAVLLTVSPGWQ